MPNIELIDKDRKGPPTGICPHCKQKMITSLDMFKDNITKIVESPCPYCKGKIFSCVLIMSNVRMDWLLDQIKIVVKTIEGTQDKRIITPWYISLYL